MSGHGGFGYGGPVGSVVPALPPEVLSSPRRRRNVAFTVFLSLAMLAGAGLVALVLLGSGAPGAIVIGVLLAALPLGPVIASYMWLDRYEPEPLGLLGFAFGWGALVATAAALVLQTLDKLLFSTPDFWSTVVVAPVTEEAAKGFFVVLLLWARRHELDGILDGIVYAGLVGVGFAFTENILYIAGAYVGGDGTGPGGVGAAAGLFIVRGIFSPFAHPLFTAAVGIGVGYAVITRSSFWRFAAPLLGYLVAVFSHALWNASAFFAGGQLFVLTYLFAMVPAFVLFVGFAVWARRREGQMLTRALTDCAHRGFLGLHEVPWLVRLSGRRAARTYARTYGGPVAAKVMGEYQQQAVELGFLHARYLRGTAPPDFARRGSAMVGRLAGLRPYLLFPQVSGGYVRAPAGQAGGGR